MEDRDIRNTYSVSNDKPLNGLPRIRSGTTGGTSGSVRALVEMYEKKVKDISFSSENEYSRSKSIGKIEELKLQQASSEGSLETNNKPHRATIGPYDINNYPDFSDRPDDESYSKKIDNRIVDGTSSLKNNLSQEKNESYEDAIKHHTKLKENSIEKKLAEKNIRNDGQGKDVQAEEIMNKPQQNERKFAEKVSLQKLKLNYLLPVIEENEKGESYPSAERDVSKTDEIIPIPEVIPVKSNQIILRNEVKKSIRNPRNMIISSQSDKVQETIAPEIFNKEIPKDKPLIDIKCDETTPHKIEEVVKKSEEENNDKSILILKINQNNSKNSALKESELNFSQNKEIVYGGISGDNSLYSYQNKIPESMSQDRENYSFEIIPPVSEPVEKAINKERSFNMLELLVKIEEEAKYSPIVPLGSPKGNIIEIPDNPNDKLKTLERDRIIENAAPPSLLQVPNPLMSINISPKADLSADAKNLPSPKPVISQYPKYSASEKKKPLVKASSPEPSIKRTPLSLNLNKIIEKPIQINKKIFNAGNEIINEIDILCSNCYEYIQADAVDSHSKKCIKPCTDTLEFSETDIKIRKLLKAISQRKLKSVGLKYNLYCKLEENSIAILEKSMVINI